MFWILLILILGLCGSVAMVVVRRGRQIGELARRGVPVEGVVTRRFTTGKSSASGPSATKRIGFRYTGPDGRSYDRFASSTGGKWREVEEGQPIALVMLPDNPGISAPAWLVDSAREALAKRKV